MTAPTHGDVGQLSAGDLARVRFVARASTCTDAEAAALYACGRLEQLRLGEPTTWRRRPGAADEARAACGVRDCVLEREVEALLAAGALAALAESVVRRAVASLLGLLAGPGRHDVTRGGAHGR